MSGQNSEYVKALRALERFNNAKREPSPVSYHLHLALSETARAYAGERWEEHPRMSCIRSALVALTGALVDRLEEEE